jgi:2-polyprenyl-3-methyl-5-hydroxy-6-metoxy-1,4-benzoquinol methylase
VDGYWNHNSAYHPLIVRQARRLGGAALDVGCGEGLLVQRLAGVSNTVVGIDPDEQALAQARQRTVGMDRVSLFPGGFVEMEAQPETFDLITFVATLHHMDTRTGLTKARTLLRPHGELIVVGLSVNRSAFDWGLSALLLPAITVMGVIHRERRDPGVVIVDPKEHLSEIRSVADDVMPGSSLRRGLYYRYILRWTKW